MSSKVKYFRLSLGLIALAAISVGCGGGAEEGAAPASTGTPAPTTAAPSAAGAMLSMGTASVSGTINYQGAVPTMKELNMAADPGCAAKHTEPVRAEALVLGDGNTMANVYVKVKSGLPAGSWPTPTGPVVLDQRGCQYIPHVTGVMVGQPFRILNSDGLLHNVHALPQINDEFNKAMPASVTETIEQFDKAEEMFQIKCDVHPWMVAYIAVTDHPFFSVTSTDGMFEIAGLPAGTYEIEAWHERLGTQSASVTVGDGASVSQNFTFSR